MQNVLAEFRRDAHQIAGITHWLDDHASEALASAALPTTNAIQCASIVLLSGYFETFLVEGVKRFIQAVNELGKPFGSLPEKVRHLHFVNGGTALARLAKRERKDTPGVTALSEDLAQRLASVNAVQGYSLVYEAFIDTRSNPGADVVRDLLSAFEIRDPWRRMDPHCDGQSNVLKTFLDSFIALRNECAHRGTTASPPTTAELRAYVNNLDTIARSFVGVLVERLAEFRALTNGEAR